LNFLVTFCFKTKSDTRINGQENNNRIKKRINKFNPVQLEINAMKIYYYFLFRVYRFYTDKMKETQIPLFYTSAVSTAVTGFNLFTVYSFLDYMEVVKMFSGKYLILIPTMILWVITHFLFVQGKRFLKYDFKKSVKGGFLVVAYILFTAVAFIIVANFNRAKLAKGSIGNPVKTEHVQKKEPSLERKIGNWLKETF